MYDEYATAFVAQLKISEEGFAIAQNNAELFLNEKIFKTYTVVYMLRLEPGPPAKICTNFDKV